MDDATKAKIKADNPGAPLTLFRIGEYELVFTAPRAASYDAWIDENKSSAGLRAMAQESLRYGTIEQFNAMLERYPAVLWDDLAKALMQMAGLGQAEVSPF